jgi:hypothetical protein
MIVFVIVIAPLGVASSVRFAGDALAVTNAGRKAG